MKNKNVVGKDIKASKNYKFSDYIIFNNASKKEFLINFNIKKYKKK